MRELQESTEWGLGIVTAGRTSRFLSHREPAATLRSVMPTAGAGAGQLPAIERAGAGSIAIRADRDTVPAWLVGRNQKPAGVVVSPSFRSRIQESHLLDAARLTYTRNENELDMTADHLA